MFEVAGGAVLAAVILVYFGELHVLAAALFGVLLLPLAVALVYYLRVEPIEIAVGAVVAAVVLGSILREANQDREKQDIRTRR